MPLDRNLIIIFARGLRSDALEDSRCWPLQTPYLQRLSEKGVRLVATSACPADHGGMVSLLTALHARQHGYLDQGQPPVPTATGSKTDGGNVSLAQQAACDGWPAQLVDVGYHLVGVGCVAAIEPWFDTAVLVKDVDAMDARDSCAYLTATRQKGITAAILHQRRQRQRSGPFEPDRLLIEPADDIDGFITDQACKLLTEMPADRRWALVVIYSGPGNGLPPPTLYEGMIDPSQLSHGFTPADFTEVDALAELDHPRVMLQRLEPQQIGRIRSDYLGRVSLIDHGLGRLQAALEDRPDHQQAWFVFGSDRGQLLGENGLVGHRSFLSPAIDVPVIIAPPGGTPKVDQNQRVSTVDVAATIAELGGCDPLKAGAGRSLVPILKGQRLDRPDQEAWISEFGTRLMLRTDRYKVIFNTDSRQAIGLYDLDEDPQEQKNLIGTIVGENLLYALRWRVGNALMPLRAMPGSAGGV